MRRLLTVLSAAALAAACDDHPAPPTDTAAPVARPEPTAESAPPRETAPDAETADSGPPLPATKVVESLRAESAFDSNQWNSAVGLAGGAGGSYAARRGRARNSASESYAEVAASGYLTVADAPLSTFAATSA